MEEGHKYDVAFSFLQEDEQLALEIADRIRDRVNVNIFIYSERQGELAGHDGIDKFSRVFGQEARVVVILHRQSWGHTYWTQVEDNAIKSRFLKNGPGFLLVVPLDSPDVLPPWIPATHIWLGLDRYGVNGVSSVIEARVQDSGGLVKNESSVDYAQKIRRTLRYAENKLRWYKSREGVMDARKEAETLCQLAQNLAEEINKNSFRVYTDSYSSADIQCLLIHDKFTLGFTWEQDGSSDLTNSLLYVVLLEGRITTNPNYFGPRPKVLTKQRFEPDIDSNSTVIWRKEKGKETFTTPQLVDTWLKELIKLIYSQREKELDEAKYS